MTGKIVILGVFVADTAYRADRPPRMGETIMGRSFALGPGGKGSNQAVAAARAGGSVAFIACVGRDAFGDKALAGYEAEGIDVDHVSRIDGVASGIALIVVDEAGENSIAVASGANACLPAEAIEAASAG